MKLHEKLFLELLNKKLYDYNHSTLKQLLFLYDSTNKINFKQNLLNVLNNFDSLDSDTKKILNMQISSILSELEKKKYISREEFLGFKVYTYENKITIYVTKWNNEVKGIILNRNVSKGMLRIKLGDKSKEKLIYVDNIEQYCDARNFKITFDKVKE